MADAGWALIVHGGAREIPDTDRDDFRRGCAVAATVGRAVLEAGGTAVDAAIAAVRALEDDPVFNAGIGASQRADGRVQRDAAVMDGSTLDVGAAAAVEGVPHPIDLAASLLREEEVLLVGPGAERLAAQRGLTAAADSHGGRERPAALDTVGCVARDRDGHLAAAVSTGGIGGARVGRVGDSPLPGEGFFADDEVGAVVLSGAGEQIARVALAAWVEHKMRAGLDPAAATTSALERLDRVGGQAGLIALDRTGRPGWAYSSPDFAIAYVSSAHDVVAFTRPPIPDIDAFEERA